MFVWTLFITDDTSGNIDLSSWIVFSVCQIFSDFPLVRTDGILIATRPLCTQTWRHLPVLVDCSVRPLVHIGKLFSGHVLPNGNGRLHVSRVRKMTSVVSKSDVVARWLTRALWTSDAIRRNTSRYHYRRRFSAQARHSCIHDPTMTHVNREHLVLFFFSLSRSNVRFFFSTYRIHNSRTRGIRNLKFNDKFFLRFDLHIKSVSLLEEKFSDINRNKILFKFTNLWFSEFLDSLSFLYY